MSKKTVAGQFVETLAAAGVKRICGVVGGHGDEVIDLAQTNLWR